MTDTLMVTFSTALVENGLSAPTIKGKENTLDIISNLMVTLSTSLVENSLCDKHHPPSKGKTF